jgi:hypothetical protein
MLSTDRLVRQLSPVSVRYADDVILFFADKADAQQAKWRIKNLWWYELRIFAKRNQAIVQPMSQPIDFCGTIYHRNKNKSIHEHNKGYCSTRRSTVDRAKVCTRKSYPSYFGLLSAADNFNLLISLEKEMKLQDLTSKIRIDRSLDAPNINIKELADNSIVFCVHDYEMRTDRNGNINWIKCKISYFDSKTNRRIVREFHGDYQGIIAFHVALEKAFPNREFLPMTAVSVENSCGFIYVGSSNMQFEMADSEEYY